MIAVIAGSRIAVCIRQVWQDMENRGTEDQIEMEVVPSPPTRQQEYVIETAEDDTPAC